MAVSDDGSEEPEKEKEKRARRSLKDTKAYLKKKSAKNERTFK